MFKIQYRKIYSYIHPDFCNDPDYIPAASEVGEWFDWILEGDTKPQAFVTVSESKKNLFQTMFDAIQESHGEALSIRHFQSTDVEENHVIYEFIFGDFRRWQFRFVKIEMESPWKIGLNDNVYNTIS